MMITVYDHYQKGNKIVLMQRPYSNVPGDAYLVTVLCLWKEQYVTWVYNKECPGFSFGHYFGDDLAAAVKDFQER